MIIYMYILLYKWIYIAAGRGHCHFVSYLIEQKADINQPNNAGCTPLMAAVIHGNLATVNEMCKSNDLDLLALNGEGDAAIDFAAAHGHTTMFSKFGNCVVHVVNVIVYVALLFVLCHWYENKCFARFQLYGFFSMGFASLN